MTFQEIKDLLDNISTNPSTTSENENWIICSRKKNDNVKENWDDEDEDEYEEDDSHLLTEHNVPNKIYMCVRGIHDGMFVWFKNDSEIERLDFETEGKKEYLRFSRWLRPKYYHDTYFQGGSDFVNDEEEDRFYDRNEE